MTGTGKKCEFSSFVSLSVLDAVRQVFLKTEDISAESIAVAGIIIDVIRYIR